MYNYSFAYGGQIFFYHIQDDGILVIPTIAGPPPKLGSKEILSKDYQAGAFSLLAIASMSGCCQVKCFSLYVFHLNVATHRRFLHL